MPDDFLSNIGGGLIGSVAEYAKRQLGFETKSATATVTGTPVNKDQAAVNVDTATLAKNSPLNANKLFIYGGIGVAALAAMFIIVKVAK